MKYTTTQSFFDSKYENNPDPWAFASSKYELDRYAAMFKALEHRRYHRAFEPGCSIGVFTSSLAEICDEVVATDVSPIAVGYARSRCGDLSNVSISSARLPDTLPTGNFDLIVLSEIGYYFESAEMKSLIQTLVGRLSSSGVLLAVHWLGKSDDHLLSGDEVHELIESIQGIFRDREERYPEFCLDRWAKQ